MTLFIRMFEPVVVLLTVLHSSGVPTTVELRWSDYYGAFASAAAFEGLATDVRFNRVQSNFLLAKCSRCAAAAGMPLFAPLAQTVITIPGCGLGNRIEYTVGSCTYAWAHGMDCVVYWSPETTVRVCPKTPPSPLTPPSSQPSARHRKQAP